MNKKVRVLITGGAGFIGSHLVDRLVDEGYLVRVIDNLSTGNLQNIAAHIKEGKVEFVRGDIRDPDLINQCLRGVDKVAHLAAQISVPLSVQNPELTMDINVEGTRNLLEASKNAGVKRFVFASSCAVYGEPKYLPINEEHPTQPISPYAESKLMAEKLCLYEQKNKLEPVVLRFFNVYGPRQGINDYSGVITKFIDRCKQKLPLIIYGDGTQTRDFVNVADIVNALMLALQARFVYGELFNIGSGVPISVKEVAEKIIDFYQSEVPFSYAPYREGDIKHSYADISKALEKLIFISSIKFDVGLQQLVYAKKL